MSAVYQIVGDGPPDAPADQLTLCTAELQAPFAPKQDQKTGPAMTAKPVENLPTQAQTLTER